MTIPGQTRLYLVRYDYTWSDLTMTRLFLQHLFVRTAVKPLNINFWACYFQCWERKCLPWAARCDRKVSCTRGEEEMRWEDKKGLATSNAGARSVSHGLRDVTERWAAPEARTRWGAKTRRGLRLLMLGQEVSPMGCEMRQKDELHQRRGRDEVRRREGACDF